MQPDMGEHGFPDDEWPLLMRRVLGAHILVIGTPIWLGDKSSVCTRVVERLYSWSGHLARLFTHTGGISSWGNRRAWSEGERFGWE